MGEFIAGLVIFSIRMFLEPNFSCKAIIYGRFNKSLLVFSASLLIVDPFVPSFTLSVGTMGQSLTSSESSVSSCNAMGSQSPTYNSFSDGVLGSGSSKRDGSGVFVNGLKGSCERSVGQNQESGRTIYNQKLEESVKISSSSMASVEKGNSGPTRKPEISVATKEKGPGHILLTHSEMHELFLKCKKPLRTMDDIKAQEFKVLVTDIVDSCHFWANIDDKVGKGLLLVTVELLCLEPLSFCIVVKHCSSATTAASYSLG